MLVVSNDFNNAFKNTEREIFTIVTINGIEYHKDKIKEMSYTTGAYSGEQFQLGSVQSASLKVTFSEVIEGFKELDEVKVEIGIKIKGSGTPNNIENVSRIGRARVGRARLISYIPDRYENVPLGTFYISERVDPNRNENTTTIEARDGFIFMEGDYESELSYPSKIANIGLEIANKSGIEIDPVSFNHLSDIRISKPEGYTFRQAIGIIAQYYVGYACFDREGKLSIRRLVDPRYKITTNEYFLKGLTKNELIYQPKGIICKVIKRVGETTETTTLRAGSSNGPQVSIENNTMTQSLLDNIFYTLKSLNYYPIDLNWRGNPAVEVGDWVELTDRQGNKFKSPILNYTITFDGGLSSTISADSKSQSGNITSFKGPLQQKLDELDYRVDAAGKNNVYEGTDEPKYPKEGDIWFKKNGPDDEIWVYQEISEGVFDWVMTTSTRMADEIKEKIENATPSDEIVKTINLSPEMDGKEWLKIKGAKIWLTNETKIDNAVITSAMIGSVNAGTVNTGTLDAGRINVINLNASSISTGTLKSINIMGVNIEGSSITGGTISGSKIIQDLSGHPILKIANASLSWYKPNSDIENYNNLWAQIMTSKEFIQLRAGDYSLLLYNGGHISWSGPNFYLQAITATNLAILNGGVEINNGLKVLSNGSTNFYTSINMNGHSILNQSDIRLKEKIVATQIDGINETKKLNLVEFNRKQFYQSKEVGAQPNSERELGLIAQYSPFLAVNKGEDNYLSIDTNKQIMLNTLTNKQLIERVELLEKRLMEIEN